GRFNKLCLQVHAHMQYRLVRGTREQVVDNRRIQHNRQHAVLETVVVENIGEAGCNNAMDTEIQQCPDRVFTGRTTTEIIPRQQNAGVTIACVIENEIRVFAARGDIYIQTALVQVTPLVEQKWPKAGTANRFQVLLRDNGIGIDVGAIQRRDDAF